MNDRALSESRLVLGPSERWSPPLHNVPEAQATIHVLVPRDDGPEPEDDAVDEPLLDPATGFATGRAWDEVFRHEDRRFARYGRPVTVVVAELEDLDVLAAVLGQGTADLLIPPVAAAIRQGVRSADFLARIGHTRFVALLSETDEVAAINCVERVRSACDAWLEASGVAVHVAMGWAQPVAGGCLADAMRLAEDRMHADGRGQFLRAAPTTALRLIDDEDQLA